MTDDPVLNDIAAWSEAREDVRAVLLTSTRAVPDGNVDALSDYDVIVVVRDIQPYADDHGWIEDFGPVLVAYWDPVQPNPDTGLDQVSNVVQYEGVLKIDFGVWSVEKLRRVAALPNLPEEFDAGYRVVVDKDGDAAALQPPSQRGYIRTLPDEDAYQLMVNDFYIGVPYVAKCLLRDEVLPAKWCLDYDMRYVYLLPMLEWLAAVRHGGEVRVGVNGKGLKRLLTERDWLDLERTWAGASVEDNWDALFSMTDLFRRAAIEVATTCGFQWPEELHQRVGEHARALQSGVIGGPL